MSHDPLFKVQLAVRSLTRSGTTSLLTEYVGHQGFFLRNAKPPPKLALLRLEMVLPPEARSIQLHGMVTWIALPERKDLTPRVEIRFFAKAGPMAVLWDDFIQRLRERYPASRRRQNSAGLETLATLSFGIPREPPPEGSWQMGSAENG